MKSALWRFASDDSGTTAIEYAVIGALISIVIVVAATAIGTKINAKFMNGIVAGLS